MSIRSRDVKLSSLMLRSLNETTDVTFQQFMVPSKFLLYCNIVEGGDDYFEVSSLGECPSSSNPRLCFKCCSSSCFFLFLHFRTSHLPQMHLPKLLHHPLPFNTAIRKVDQRPSLQPGRCLPPEKLHHIVEMWMCVAASCGVWCLALLCVCMEIMCGGSQCCKTP